MPSNTCQHKLSGISLSPFSCFSKFPLHGMKEQGLQSKILTPDHRFHFRATIAGSVCRQRSPPKQYNRSQLNRRSYLEPKQSFLDVIHDPIFVEIFGRKEHLIWDLKSTFPFLSLTHTGNKKKYARKNKTEEEVNQVHLPFHLVSVASSRSSLWSLPC